MQMGQEPLDHGCDDERLALYYLAGAYLMVLDVLTIVSRHEQVFIMLHLNVTNLS